jgi:hypothetical protein
VTPKTFLNVKNKFKIKKLQGFYQWIFEKAVINSCNHMVFGISSNNVNKVHRVGPATKDKGAGLFTPGIVVVVDGAEGSLGDWWHKHDIPIGYEDNLVMMVNST